MRTEMDEKAKMLRDGEGYQEMEQSLVDALLGLGYDIKPLPPRLSLTADLPAEVIEAEVDEMDNRLSIITYSLGLPEYLFMTSSFVSEHWTRPRPQVDNPDWSTDDGDIPIPPPPHLLT